MENSSNPITVNAAWERPIIARGQDVALHLTVSAHRSTTAASARPPVDIAFVIDRSGSMSGGKLELAKEAVNQAVSRLNDDDRMAVVIFDDSVQDILPLMPASKEMQGILAARLNNVHPGGSTNLSDGWLTGCQHVATANPPAPVGRMRRVILLTDGQANAGITDAAELAHHAGVLRGNGISTTTMGLGEGFDELLLGGMAEAGGGNFQHISAATGLRKIFDDEIGEMTTIAALMPRLEIRLPEGVTGELLNQFPSRMVGRQLQIDLRDLAGGEIVDLVILLSQHSAVETGPVDVLARYRYTVPETGRRVQQEVTLPRLFHGNAMDATAAPITPAVQITRAMEESLRDQRQALAFDRAGRFEESRRAFGDSHARLAQADAVAASSGYAGVSPEMLQRMRAESARSMDLAAAPAAPLDEHTHKERAAYRSNASRGHRQGDRQG
jgi:Ca-activated chloride channel family protein